MLTPYLNQLIKYMLKDLIKINEPIHYASLSGVILGKYYRTVFPRCGTKFQPYVLFQDGSSAKVQLYKNKETKEEYNFFNYENKRYIYDIQEPIWFQSNLVNGVSNEGIESFLNDSIQDRTTLYERLREKIMEYYDFYHEEELDLVIAHAIHTYLLGLLGKAVYILLDGERNTGKSTLQNLLAMLQYNGCFVGKSSIAAMVRKVHFLGAAINLDEFEKLDPKEKAVVTGILNSGAYKSGTSEITNMDVKSGANQITVFHTFGAKTFSVNKSHFHNSFISRCIVINTIRNRKPVKNIYGLTEREKDDFQSLRDDLFSYTLKHCQDIQADIGVEKCLLDERKAFGRRADITAIVLGVIRHFGGDIEKVRGYLLAKEELDTEDEAQHDKMYLVLKYLTELYEWKESEYLEFSNQELLDYIEREINTEDSRYMPTASSVGKMLKRSKLVIGKNDRKRVAGKGNYKYVIPRQRVHEVIDRSGFEDLIRSMPPIRSFTSSQKPHLTDSEACVKDSVNSVAGTSPPF